jgi:hypothetical protein
MTCEEKVRNMQNREMLKEMYTAKLHVRRRHSCYRRGNNHCERDVVKWKVMEQR